MKTLRIKVVLTMLLTAYAVALAEYLPFLEDGKSWIVALVEDDAPNPMIYKQISVITGRIINDKECYEIVIRDVELAPEEMWNESKWRYSHMWLGSHTVYAYEEDGYVYRLNPLNGTSELLFGIDEKISGFPDPIAYETEINGITRKYWFYDIYQQPGLMVEGIGSNFNFWRFIRHGYRYSSIQGNAVLVECFLNGKRLFCADDFNTLLNQVCDVSEIKTDDTPSSLFDLNGRAIPAPQPGEIYIDNGTKKIMR